MDNLRVNRMLPEAPAPRETYDQESTVDGDFSSEIPSQN